MKAMIARARRWAIEGLVASRDNIRSGLEAFRPHKKKFIVFWSASACLIFLLLPFDDAILAAIRQPEDTGWNQAARMISRLTDLHNLPLWIAGGFWIAGLAAGKRNWRRSAWACVLAAVLAGLVCNIFRGGLGRGRPYEDIPNEFYGPTVNHRYQGFPSGHAAHMFAFAGALTVTSPPLGLPMLILAADTGWSRMQLAKHRPSDIVAGGSLGLTVGLMVGLGARRRNQRENQTVVKDPGPPDYRAV